MTFYKNSNINTALAAAELYEIDGMQYALFHMRSGAECHSLNALADSSQNDFKIISETEQPHGETLIFARGQISPETVLAELRKSGEDLIEEKQETAGFNPWKWRGLTSIVGQSLQLASSFTASGGGTDKNAVLSFAAFNMVANACNMIFGSQHKPDEHQLAYLKEQFNTSLQPLLGEKAQLPAVNSNPLDSRDDIKPEGLGQQLYHTAQKYSVTVGEVGLRMLGTISLAYPPAKWRLMAEHISQGNIAQAFIEGANREADGSLHTNFYAGLVTLAGKLTSLTAKEADPYSPEKVTLIDKFRQDIAFPLSSIIEGSAATWMAADRLANRKIEIAGKEMPDFFGGLGNAVFVGGYGIRFTAPYGSLEVDMPQLYAHISDALTQLPKEMLPSVMAQTAIELKKHFSEKDISAAEIYAHIANDLEKHHHITIDDIPHMQQKSAEVYAAHTPFPTQQAAANISCEEMNIPAADNLSAAQYQQKLLNTQLEKLLV